MIYQNGYKTNIAIDCFSSCLFNYLDYLKIKVPKYETFIIGEGLKISFNCGIKNFVTSDKRVVAVYVDAMKKYSIQLQDLQCKQNPYYFLNNRIKEDKNIMIAVTSGTLPYNTIFQNHTSMGHYINAIGINNKGNKVYISDGYVPTRILSSYEGWMDIGEFVKNWSLRKYKYMELCMNYADKINISKKVKKLDINGIIKEQLSLYINGRYDSQKKLYFGASAIDEFAKHVLSFVNYEGNELNELVYNHVYHFKLQGFFIGKKSIQMILSSRNYLDKELESKALEFINEWDKIMLNILKVKFINNEKKLITLRDKISSLNERECQFYSYLINNL